MTFFSSHCLIWLHKWSIFIHDLSTHVAWLHISSDYTPDLIMIMICPRYDMTTHVVRIHSSSEHTAHLATQVIYLICDLTTLMMYLQKWADYTCDPCTPVIYTRIWVNHTSDLSTQVVRLYSWSLSIFLARVKNYNVDVLHFFLVDHTNLERACLKLNKRIRPPSTQSWLIWNILVHTSYKVSR
jgi:hypothetical protein